MSKTPRMRVAPLPISTDGMEVVDFDDLDLSEFDREDFEKSPTLQHAVEFTGESLGQLEAFGTDKGKSFRLQDPNVRNKREQVEQTLCGYAGEMATVYLAQELGLSVEWLEDESGYCGDAVLMPEPSETYRVEIKTCQMNSLGQNIPHRGSYDNEPKEGWRKAGEIPDVLVFAYMIYTGNSIIVAIEGCEPFDEDLGGILSRTPERKAENFWVYDRKFIRHSVEQIDGLVLDKLRKD